MNHQYFAESENIILKPFGEIDSEQYRILRNEDSNRKFFFSDEFISVDTQKKWYKGYLEKTGEYMFSIYHKSSELFLGAIGIYDVNEICSTAEVGRIIIDNKIEIAKGKGYGAEAIIALSRFAFEKLNIQQLYAYIYSDNLASIKSFEKAEYQRQEVRNNIIKMILYSSDR